MRLYYRAGTGRPIRVAWELEPAAVNFAGVLDAAPERVGAYLERLRARPAFMRAAQRTESLLATS